MYYDKFNYSVVFIVIWSLYTRGEYELQRL